jgi:tetratricopeptide (TPR) repeat protein
MELAFSTNPIVRLQGDKSFLQNAMIRPYFSYDWYKEDETENKNSSFNKQIISDEAYEDFFISDKIQYETDSIFINCLQLIKKGDYEKASELIEVHQYSDNPIYHDIKGLIHLHESELQNAIEEFSIAIELMPSFSLAYHNRSIVYKLTGDFKQSISDLDEAISLNSEYAVFYFSKGLLFQKLNMTEEAVDHYLKAIDISTYYPEANTNYSNTLKMLGKYDEALIELNKNISNNPDEPKNYLQKAGINLIYGEFEMASELYKYYLELNPEDEEAYYNLGISLILSNNISEGCYYLFKNENPPLGRENFMLYNICKSN